MTAVVSAVSWQRSQVIEEYQRVDRKGWEDAIPSNATLVSCALQYRYDSDTPRPIATEVCGEPYTIDTGTGLGQVVQDCVYRVYENYCTYTTMDWLPVETLVTTGEDLRPYWPTFELANEQRQGNSTERYVITFSAAGDSFTYSTTCLLYTSDAADDLLCVDLGDRRIIKKKLPIIFISSTFASMCVHMSPMSFWIFTMVTHL